MPVSRLPAIVAVAALLVPPSIRAQAQPLPAAPRLHDLVESAWQRSPLAHTLAARRDETAAAGALSGSWLGGAPTLGLSSSSDRWMARRGQRESELSLSAPVLLPSQHAARRLLARTGGDELDARQLQAKLAIAGEVRLRLWEAAAASAVLAEKQDYLDHLTRLAADVQRRVRVGELARSDGLMAEQEVHAATADLTAARSRAAESLSRWRLVTGASGVPDLPPEALPVADGATAGHIRLRAALATRTRASAAQEVAAANRQAPPTVALSVRRERDTAGAASAGSIGIALQIPLGGALRNRPGEAAAATELATASAELAQVQASVEAELQLAHEQLGYARQALDAATARAVALREHTALFDKAFRLGEKPLAELLRSQALSHEAALSLRRQHIMLALAHAQLNQAYGIIP